jgi:hypothetical protein
MDNKLTANNRTKTIFGITLVMLLIVCAVSAVKRIFVGLDVDEEYAVTLAYRIAKGDILMKEMWEPHMLSGLLLAIPTWLFMTIRKDTEFLIVALRIFGVLLQAFVCFVWYRVWRKRTNPFTALFSAGLIFMVLPKFIQTPEFANVQIWFLLLTGLFIMAADDGRRKVFYVLAGISYVFVLLTYPTCIILLPLYLILLAKKKGIIPFLAPILVFGVGFFIYVLKVVGMDTALSSVGYILADDSHSGGMGAKLLGYLGELPLMLLYLVIYAVIALALSALISLISKSAIKSRVFVWQALAIFVAVSFLDQLRFWFVLHTPNVHPQYRFAALFIAAVVLYATLDKEKRSKHGEAFGAFVIGSCLAMLAILALTNLDVKATLVHLLPAVLFWIAVMGDSFEEKKTLKAVTIVAVLIALGVNCFGQSFLVRVNNEGQYEDVLFSQGGKRLSFHGPSKRIYCGYWEGEEKNANYDYIRSTVPEGSKVLYIGEGSTTYLIGNMEVCAPSVISTPSFNNNTIEYFGRNPQKMPEYVIIENTYLEENRYVSSEFRDWLDNLCEGGEESIGEYISIIKINK